MRTLKSFVHRLNTVVNGAVVNRKPVTTRIEDWTVIVEPVHHPETELAGIPTARLAQIILTDPTRSHSVLVEAGARVGIRPN
jgi:hypothetical protein